MAKKRTDFDKKMRRFLANLSDEERLAFVRVCQSIAGAVQGMDAPDLRDFILDVKDE